jgi:hypothetical protein
MSLHRIEFDELDLETMICYNKSGITNAMYRCIWKGLYIYLPVHESSRRTRNLRRWRIRTLAAPTHGRRRTYVSGAMKERGYRGEDGTNLGGKLETREVSGSGMWSARKTLASEREGLWMSIFLWKWGFGRFYPTIAGRFAWEAR